MTLKQFISKAKQDKELLLYYLMVLLITIGCPIINLISGDIDIFQNGSGLIIVEIIGFLLFSGITFAKYKEYKANP